MDCYRDNVWSLMTGRSAEGAASLVMHEVLLSVTGTTCGV